MVNIREKKTGEQTYYYLEHSIREGRKVIKKEKYLGKDIPKDIERIKREFVVELYKDKCEQFKKSMSKPELIETLPLHLIEK